MWTRAASPFAYIKIFVQDARVRKKLEREMDLSVSKADQLSLATAFDAGSASALFPQHRGLIWNPAASSSRS
jgi:hypothetical protein